jgi:hypothetical protein
LCKFRFLFTANHGEASIASSVVPSRLGGYIVRELLANFTFVENAMFDTYIADPKVWQTLRDLSHQIEAERHTVARIRLRIERAKEFFNYMHQCLLVLVTEAQKRGLPPQWCHDCLGEREHDFRRELSRVLASARTNSKKKNIGSSKIGESAFEEEDMSNV